MLRLGIFGGTFDPPHRGHVAAVCAARDGAALDVVRVVVANDPWQKESVTPATERLHMAELAFCGLDAVAVDDCEIRRGGPSYTIDTVRGFAAPDVRLCLVLGADAAAGLDTWRDADEIRRICEMVIVARPGARVAFPGATFVPCEPEDVSSTEIRRRVAAGEPYAEFVPADVAADIAASGRYRTH